MSTVTKLSADRKLAKQMRQNLLRNPPQARDPRNVPQVAMILAKLRAVARNSKLTGEQKDSLFIEGATYLRTLV